MDVGLRDLGLELCSLSMRYRYVHPLGTSTLPPQGSKYPIIGYWVLGTSNYSTGFG